MSYIQKDSGLLAGRVGQGRDVVPAAAQVDVGTLGTVSSTTVPLAHGLRRLRLAHPAHDPVPPNPWKDLTMSRASLEGEPAWTSFIAQSFENLDARIVAVWMAQDNGDLYVEVVLDDGRELALDEVPGGVGLVPLLVEYFNGCRPEFGVDVRRRAQLSALSDVNVIGDDRP